MKSIWERSSWRKKARRQMPEYGDSEKLQRTEKSLNKLPPLVFAGEVRNLKKPTKNNVFF